MPDSRFDNKVYFLKTKPGEMERLKEICREYNIQDNGVFKEAASFHFAWGITKEGLFYISPTNFIYRKPDFNSIEEFEDFLILKTPSILC